MKPTDVSLTSEELQIAAMVGLMRQIQNLFAGRDDADGASPESGWQYHLEGAAGEMAFAKWADKYWSGNLGNLKADDVGMMQVRTRSRHSYELIIKERDPDDRIFVLLTGLAPHFRLRGWIWGWEGKCKEWYGDICRNGRPNYFVPHAALHPMHMSPRLLKLERPGSSPS